MAKLQEWNNDPSSQTSYTKGEEIFVSFGDKYFLIRDFWKNINKNKALEKAALYKKDQAAKGNKQ
ncbi:MAG TPA: hypothetical protein VIM89_20675 [Mucilaginibacter sp.]